MIERTASSSGAAGGRRVSGSPARRTVACVASDPIRPRRSAGNGGRSPSASSRSSSEGAADSGEGDAPAGRGSSAGGRDGGGGGSKAGSVSRARPSAVKWRRSLTVKVFLSSLIFSADKGAECVQPRRGNPAAAVERPATARSPAGAEYSTGAGRVFSLSLAHFAVIAIGGDPYPRAVGGQRHRAVTIGAQDGRSGLPIPPEHLGVGVAEAVAVAGGHDGDGGTRRGQEARRAARPAAVVRDLERECLSQDEPRLARTLDVAGKDDRDVPMTQDEDDGIVVARLPGRRTAFGTKHLDIDPVPIRPEAAP